jgi:uncharacterized membrane protein (Fun14 family)
MSFEPSSLAPFATSIGFGGVAGFLIGYAIKKVMKVMLIIIGLIFVAFIYLEYNKVLSIDWSKIQLSVVDGLSGFVNMTNGNIPSEFPFPSGGDQLISAALTNYGIPITGSLAAGFVVGFMKG